MECGKLNLNEKYEKENNDHMKNTFKKWVLLNAFI